MDFEKNRKHFLSRKNKESRRIHALLYEAAGTPSGVSSTKFAEKHKLNSGVIHDKIKALVAHGFLNSEPTREGYYAFYHLADGLPRLTKDGFLKQ